MVGLRPSNQHPYKMPSLEHEIWRTQSQRKNCLLNLSFIAETKARNPSISSVPREISWMMRLVNN
jgi:hypothetical protein